MSCDFSSLPLEIDQLADRSWEFFAPFYADLQERPLTRETAGRWLRDWSNLVRVFSELYSVLIIEKTGDTADPQREEAFNTFLATVYPQVALAEQELKERLIAADQAGELPAAVRADLAVTLRNMGSEASLFRPENVALQTELEMLGTRYDKLTGGLTVSWEGQEKNLSQLAAHLESKERQERERAWRLYAEQWRSIRAPLDDLYLDMLERRRRMARTAGLPDFVTYAFRERGRFDYGPADCLVFHQAIEETIVPAVNRILDRVREQLGGAALRPWDWIPENAFLVEPGFDEPLLPYQQEEELIRGGLNIFHQVDQVLGRHFADMAEHGLLDLESRRGKALGGYCSALAMRRKPFIFMNGNGTHNTIMTLLHEAGHAFHVYEGRQPLIWQEEPPIEFAEVASMAMELLASPYLLRERGGFYSAAETARAQIDHLRKTLLFLPYMAAVDAFQHEVYAADRPLQAADLGDIWLSLEERFLGGVDWSGFEDMRRGGWQRKMHIFQAPFYYVEYGIASIGALQIWRSSQIKGEAAALAAYRQALSLAGTRPLPELFATAGAELRFDAAILTELVTFVEQTIAALEKQLQPAVV